MRRIQCGPRREMIVEFQCGAEQASALLLETETSVQRGSDIDHVYALEEIVQGRGCTKGHAAGGIFPDRDHDSGDCRGCRASLKRLLNARLFTRRSRAEGAIDRNDDQIMTVVLQVRDLKRRHRIRWLCRRFSHVSGAFHRDASWSMSVSYPGVSVFYQSKNMMSGSIETALPFSP